MRIHLIALLTLFAIVLGACGADDPLASPTDLAGSWQLTAGTHRGATIDPIASHPVTIELDGDRVGGTAACNGYGGTFEMADGTITFSQMSITEMACSPKETMDIERQYMTALGAITEARIEGERLILTGPETRLEFVPLPPVPTAGLQGTVWVLDGLIESDAVSSVGGDTATLEIFTDGSFIASTGCRSLVGTYVESAGAIVTTSMTAEGECPDDLAAQDSHVVTVLEGEFRVEIDGRRLTLTVAGDEGLTYIAEG